MLINYNCDWFVQLLELDAVPSITLNVKFPTSMPLSILRVAVAVIPSTTFTVDFSKEISNSDNNNMLRA
jgi:hypothetical protein